MFSKRKFIKEFCREVEGQKMFIIMDETGGEVFVDRLFNDKDAQAVLNLVVQAYEVGVKDMMDSINKTMKVATKAMS